MANWWNVVHNGEETMMLTIVKNLLLGLMVLACAGVFCFMLMLREPWPGCDARSAIPLLWCK